MLKKGLALIMAVITAISIGGCGTKGSVASSESETGGPAVPGFDNSTHIALSDDGITVSGQPISVGSGSSVYAANDIIYYHDGQNDEYGDGSKSDEHSSSEADAHTVVHITEAGTYSISGTLSAGQIFVDLGDDSSTDENAVVTLILQNADITCTVAPAILFYNVFECGDKQEENATATVDTSAAGANVVISDGSKNNINGAYVAKIYKEGTEKKLYKFDGAFYSRMSMNIDGGEKNDGILNITAANEGLDSEMHLTINGGNISIESQDDGINTNEDGISVTTINGGTLRVNAGLGTEGDGIDSNGYLVVNGGSVFTMANKSSPDGGIDAANDILLNGGTVIACGMRNDAVSSLSSQDYMELSFGTTVTKGSVVTLKNGEKTVLEFTTEKQLNSLAITCPELEKNIPYTLCVNGIVQQYTSTFSMGMGAFGGNRPTDGEKFDMSDGTRHDKSDGVNPDMPDGTKPNRPNGVNPDMPDGTKPSMPQDSNISPSTEFMITETTHTFSGIGDSADSAGKTAVTISANGATAKQILNGDTSKITVVANETEISLDKVDLQFSVTDIPSENYAANALLSDGTDALSALFPTDGGDYRLTVAVVSDVYTGTLTMDFSVEYSAEKA